MAEIEARIMMANPLPEWAREPEFAWFAEAYSYAAIKTLSIPALAKCTPSEIYSLLVIVLGELDLLAPHPTDIFQNGHPISRPLQVLADNEIATKPVAAQQGAANDPKQPR